MGTQAARLRWLRRAVVVAVLAAVVSPAVRNRDSTPLSTYPMYAGGRAREVTLATAVAVGAEGDVQRLSLATIARTDDPLIAESLVAGAIRSGWSAQLCREVAARVASDPTEVAVAVEVVEERHDVVELAAGRPSLVERTVHARCDASPAEEAER